MTLGAVDFVLDNETFEEVLGIFEELNLWLELARFTENLEPLESFSVEVRSVQAYELHKLSLVSPHREERRAARECIKDKIKLASMAGAKRVIAVPAYGHAHAPDAYATCVKSFRQLADCAASCGVSIAIEALSPRRTSFLPSLRQVVALVREIDRENVQAMADTLHLYHAGENLAEILNGAGIAELHLRDTGSAPPGKGSIDFEQILRHGTTAELCLEYRQSGKDALREAVSFIRGLLAR